MNPSLGLVFALFLLAPGLSFFAGLFLGEHRGGVQPAPPPPGSLTALVLVGMSALAVHALGAVALAFAATIGRVQFDFFAEAAATARGAPNGARGMAVALGYLLALSVAGYLAARAAYGFNWVRRSLYGWMADSIERSRRTDRYVSAYVLSAVTHDRVRLGYQGLVENVMLDSDREIESLVLLDVSRFTLRLSDHGHVYTRRHEGDALPRLHLDHTQIGNIVFDVFDYLPPSKSPAPDGPERGLVARGLVGLTRLYGRV